MVWLWGVRSEAADSEQFFKRLQTLIHTQGQMLAEALEESKSDSLSESQKGVVVEIEETEALLLEAKDFASLKDTEVRVEAKEADKRYEAYEGEREAFEFALRGLKKERRTFEDAMLKTKSLRREAELAIESVGELEGSECPTCHQAVTLLSSKKVLKVLSARLEDLSGRFDSAKAGALAVEAKTDALGAIPPAPHEERLDFLKQNLAKAKRSGSDLEAHLESLRQEAGRIDAVVGEQKRRRDKLAGQIEDAKLELGTVKAEFESYESEISRLDACVVCFGNAGLKSFLIEAAIPEINRCACVYAQRLCGAGSYVRISATTTTKTSGKVREKLTVQGCIPGAADSYEGASKGQKKRLDLALLLAFREVVAHRSQASISQLFADELFDGLDRSGTDSVVDLLRTISAECPVILVTHDDRLKSVGDQTILVRHSDGIAYVEGKPTSPKRKKKKLKRVAVITNGR